MPTPSSYLQSLKEPRKSELTTLHKLITKHAPSFKPFVLESAHGDTLGYGKYSYETKSGCKGEWYTIGIGSRKNYMSLYILPIKDGEYLPELYKKKLPKCNIGRSCINIKSLDDVDMDVLTTLVKEAHALGMPS